jgi:hypothetical protein
MRRVLAVSLFAASFSALLFAPSAHAFGIKPFAAQQGMDVENSLDVSPLFLDFQKTQSQDAQASTDAVVQNVAGLVADAITIASEGFEDVSQLAGRGWAFQNNSSPPPATPNATGNWRQGTSGFQIPSEAGSPNSYIAVLGEDASNNPGNGGQLSDWLITPQLSFDPGAIFSFATRTKLGTFVGELLEVRLSTNGDSTDVGSTPTSLGDFKTLLLSIGDLQDNTVFPGSVSANNTYGLFSITSGLPKSGKGRIAFRYVGNDAGNNPTGGATQGNLITIDSVNYPVPEPVTSSMAGFGVLGLLSYFKKRKLRSM